MRVLVTVVKLLSLNTPLTGIRLWRNARSKSFPASSSPTTPTGNTFYSKIGKIVDGVRPAARNHLAITVLQNQHRRFARNARNFAKHKLISDQIGSTVIESLGKDSTIFRRRSFSLICFVIMIKNHSRRATQDFSHERALRSAIVVKIVSTISAGWSSTR